MIINKFEYPSTANRITNTARIAVFQPGWEKKTWKSRYWTRAAVDKKEEWPPRVLEKTIIYLALTISFSWNLDSDFAFYDFFSIAVSSVLMDWNGFLNCLAGTKKSLDPRNSAPPHEFSFVNIIATNRIFCEIFDGGQWYIKCKLRTGTSLRGKKQYSVRFMALWKAGIYMCLQALLWDNFTKVLSVTSVAQRTIKTPWNKLQSSRT